MVWKQKKEATVKIGDFEKNQMGMAEQQEQWIPPVHPSFLSPKKVCLVILLLRNHKSLNYEDENYEDFEKKKSKSF